MIDNTYLPMTAIALAAGYGSLRRFNRVFAAVYKPPTALRRTSHASMASAVRFFRYYINLILLACCSPEPLSTHLGPTHYRSLPAPSLQPSSSFLCQFFCASRIDHLKAHREAEQL
jgi:hypothetical protein